MKIILKEDVQNLGHRDDVVEVKNGYALNYLIPQGFAIMATPSALKTCRHTESSRFWAGIIINNTKTSTGKECSTSDFRRRSMNGSNT